MGGLLTAVILMLTAVMGLMAMSRTAPSARSRRASERPNPSDRSSRTTASQASTQSRSAHSGKVDTNMPKRRGRLGLLFLTSMLGVALVAPAVVFADTSVNSPNQVQVDTIRLNWTGQGATNGNIDD